MNRISDFSKLRRVRDIEIWTLRIIWAEGFFLTLFPSISTFAIILGILLWLVRLKIDKNFKFRSLPYDLPIILFVVISTASIIFSPVKSFELFYNFLSLAGIYILTYILIGQNIRTPEQIKILIKGIGASAVFVVFGGFFQYIFGVDIADMKWIDGEAFPELRKRIFSTLENPNVLAGYLDVMICIALGILAKFGNKKQKIFIAVAIFLMTVCLAMTYSRGAFLTLAIIFVIYGIIQDWRILIIFLALMGIIFFSETTFSERIISIFTDTLDSSEGLRIGIWVSTIPMIADHPFVGVGWGAFKFIYPQYNYYLADTSITIFHAHNLYLNTAAEIGIVGAMAYFWYFFGTMFMALDLRSNHRYTIITTTAEFFIIKIWEFISESNFFRWIIDLKNNFKKSLENLSNKILKKFNSKPEKPSEKEKRDPNLVHHDELKRSSRKKNSKKNDDDDDKFDLQKFSEQTKKEILVIENKNFVAGIRYGIGLAFLSMAINGLSDNLLFNMQSSILMWQLGALAAACQIFLKKDEKE
ncbi:MAG: O-antigen ligase family protein [Selenomonadaceae bacterium]|nr:O-antigen ligase family protein [Selenomonadaceae bacterium]